MKLNKKTLSEQNSKVSKPSYERNRNDQRIVHFGIGGFHRSHQAVYTHKVLENDSEENWSILGVGLLPSDLNMKNALESQDYLYSLMILAHEKETEVSIIGALTGFIFAPEHSKLVLDKLVSADLRIASLTITEGGYPVDENTGKLILENENVRYDLANPSKPITVFGYLTEALALRRSLKMPAFTVMSCDNVPHNGDISRKAILGFAASRGDDLAQWINENVSFPNSMVDRITPTTTEEHKHWLKDNYDIEDNWPVVCEPYIQWVVEDKFCNGRPPWETVGVEFTDNVAPYEAMKIRLLNASHTAMAYLGYLAGYRYTHEIMEDPLFRHFIKDFMDTDATPRLEHIPGVDLDAYKNTLLERFSNKACGDQLERLCAEGSSKFPKFLLPTINQILLENGSLKRVALITASWAYYLRQRSKEEINDLNADTLYRAVNTKEKITKAFLNLREIFGSRIADSQHFHQEFDRAFQKLDRSNVNAALKATMNTAERE